jgi:hypothetical protein
MKTEHGSRLAADVHEKIQCLLSESDRMWLLAFCDDAEELIRLADKVRDIVEHGEMNEEGVGEL